MSEKFESWGIVEIMGHQRIAGRLSEQVIAGANLLRVDIPTGDGEQEFRTEYVGGQSIYRLHPTDETVARAAAKGMRAQRPHYAYEVDRQLLEPKALPDDSGDDGFDNPDNYA